MEKMLQYILPIYFVLYFGIAFVLKSVIIARRIGKNPIVLPKDDSAYGLVGFYFKIVLILIFVYVLAFGLFPSSHIYFMVIEPLKIPTITHVGLALLLISMIWTIIAQGHMKNSWRVGIDAESQTELITTGFFSISRNPIFLGMIISLLGLFLSTPNAITAIFLILSYVLIQVQIRLEEEYLTKIHGDAYLSYKRRVRRLL